VDDAGSVSGADAPTAVVTPAGTVQTPAADTAFEPPATVDRYALGETLGAGGLGVVYEAWDPKLERRVAVKLVRPKGRRDANGSERFLREAQALARLSHPNVVGVYGVGTCEDGETVYVVMEHIEGRTLRAWSQEAPRTVSEVLEVFRAAGRGLAAAHAAGIVHRDFKPDNVMVDRSGRVRVLDFGLALVGGEGTMSAAEVSADAVTSGESLDVRLTAVGVVMGTPVYMAPEQHVGKPVSAASDQFAFCISMLSILRDGAPIFVGKGARALAVAKSRGDVQPAPAGDATPGWLDAALRRGLAPEPAERWPSMEALLAGLEGPPRRRRWVVAAPVVGLAVAGVFAAAWPEGRDCTDGASRLANAWTAQREGAIRTLEAELGARASQSVVRLEARFDADVPAWRAAFVATCEGHEQGRVDDQEFDRRIACLRDRADARERLLDSLRADDDTASGLVDVLVRLEPVEDCTDDVALLAADSFYPTPTDEHGRAEATVIRDGIERVDAMMRDGQLDTAATSLDHLDAQALRLGFEPILAEVGYARGRLEGARGNREASAEHFEDALATAEGAGHDYIAAGIAADLVFVYGKLRRQDDAERLLAKARALAERVGHPPAIERKLASGAMISLSNQQRFAEALEAIESSLPPSVPEGSSGRYHYSVSLNNMALVNMRMGEDRRAIELLQEALTMREELLGEDHPKLGTLHLNIAKAMARSGNFVGAEEHSTTSLELSSTYGEAHVGVSRALISRGVVRKKMGRFDEAREDYERALAIVRASKRPVAEAMLLANLGNLEKRVGNLEGAMDFHAKALAIREEELGTEAIDVAASLGDIGALHRRMKRFEQAWTHFDRELEIKRNALGDDHPSLVPSRLHRANLALDQADYDKARAELDAGFRIVRRKALDDTASASSFVSLGRLEFARGRHEEAVAAYREGIERHQRLTGNPGVLGGARLGLAKAYWALGRAGEARNALSAARVELRNGGNGVAEDLAELEEVAESWSGPQASP
jgi:tetratricopeptide (TPR) repeat protein/predicted Ser/Thr protein kinase